MGPGKGGACLRPAIAHIQGEECGYDCYFVENNLVRVRVAGCLVDWRVQIRLLTALWNCDPHFCGGTNCAEFVLWKRVGQLNHMLKPLHNIFLNNDGS